VAGLLTSAVSGISPSINSVIAVVNQEFVGARAEAEKLRLARWLSLAVGVIIIVGSLAMGGVQGNLVEVSGKTVNVFFYPMFGLFFLALFIRFATAPGAIMGAVYGLTAGVVVGFWDVVTGQPKISFQWIGPTALLVSLTAGGLFSLLTAKNRTPFTAWLWSGTGIAALGLIVARLVALRS